MRPCYFFGCGNRIGHYLHEPGGKPVHSAGPFWWMELYGAFCPGRERPRHGPRPEVQSACKVTHVQGWTVLASWDRSVDERGTSNGAFLAEGTYGFEGMIALAREHFPQIVERVERAAPLHLAAGTP